MRSLWWLIVFVLLGCQEPSQKDPHDQSGSGVSEMPRDASTSPEVPDAGASPAEPEPPEVVPGTGCPMPASDLRHWLSGSEDDAQASPRGPGLLLLGGGIDDVEALQWQRDMIDGGDVVVLRTSGDDGYNPFLYSQIGGVDSVETLRVNSKRLADDPYVACRIEQAEAVFIAGGDQAEYMEYWSGRKLAASLERVWARGGVLGGTSAGLAVLGGWVFAASSGGVSSAEMLQNPFNEYATLTPALVRIPTMSSIITDSHFVTRDRMGRLLGFVARVLRDGLNVTATGLGIDEDGAFVVGPDGVGTVIGPGKVFVIASDASPLVCEPDQPLSFENLSVRRLQKGDSIDLGMLKSSVAPYSVSVLAGVLSPANPYAAAE